MEKRGFNKRSGERCFGTDRALSETDGLVPSNDCVWPGDGMRTGDPLLRLILFASSRHRTLWQPLYRRF